MTILTWALIYFVIGTHLTNIATTLYLHRAMSHGGLELSRSVTLPMRIWIWLTTAVNTKEWVAIHRKHHIYTERDGDPHSPKIFGNANVVLRGWWLYHKATQDSALLAKYGKGTPEDWIERKILTPYPILGPVLLGVFNVAVFGWVIGAVLIVAQAIWMPICGDVVNGIGHWLGYRNTDTKDWSRNISPWGIVLAGEELHNNHHADPRSPRFSMRWFEFDIGWFYIKIFSALGLARVKHRDHRDANNVVNLPRPAVEQPMFAEFGIEG